MKLLARWRVPLGFLCAAMAMALAKPSSVSWTTGGAIAMCGECLRVWAAGHIEKGREITRSGPYRFVRHPLYLGSTFLAAGFATATRSVVVAVLACVYVLTTILSAIRTEEAELDQAFDGAYARYRAGADAAIDRPFSWARVMANREYQAVIGLVAVFLFLLFRI